MDLGLSDSVFVVTGGTAGLGLATARCLAAEGARVLVTGRTQARFDRAYDTFGVHTERIAFLAGNNTDTDLPKRIAEAALTRWGRLDGLLVSVGGPPASKALTTDDAVWQQAFDSVFLGTVRLVRDLAPVIADGGAIALVLAISAKEAAPNIPVSNGLRPGLAMLAKSFADELGPRAIRVNTLLPNLFATDRVKNLLGDATPPSAGIALKRMGDPAEFGRIATVLLSPVASYLTGAAISIDGGQSRGL